MMTVDWSVEIFFGYACWFATFDVYCHYLSKCALNKGWISFVTIAYPIDYCSYLKSHGFLSKFWYKCAAYQLMGLLVFESLYSWCMNAKIWGQKSTCSWDFCQINSQKYVHISSCLDWCPARDCLICFGFEVRLWFGKKAVTVLPNQNIKIKIAPS